jgi:hypothetical protein
MVSNYAPIRTVGVSAGQSAINNPMSYCLNTELTNGFLHGSSAQNVDLNSLGCQYFLSQYCSEEWDSYCEVASLRTDNSTPYSQLFPDATVNIYNPNAGEILIRNTLIQKYLVEVINGHLEYEPFDPTVASSPMIAKWTQNYDANTDMRFVYDVDAKTIDSCNVMNRALAIPNICNDVLNGIYLNRVRQNKTHELKGTFLGKFYELNGMPI